MWSVKADITMKGDRHFLWVLPKTKKEILFLDEHFHLEVV